MNVSIFRTTCFFDRLVFIRDRIPRLLFLSFFFIHDDTVCSRREEIFRDGITENVALVSRSILNFEIFRKFGINKLSINEQNFKREESENCNEVNHVI